MRMMASVMGLLAAVAAGAAGQPSIEPPGMIASGFVFQTVPFASAHASTMTDGNWPRAARECSP
jgi:hypothetical protein